MCLDNVRHKSLIWFFNIKWTDGAFPAMPKHSLAEDGANSVLLLPKLSGRRWSELATRQSADWWIANCVLGKQQMLHHRCGEQIKLHEEAETCNFQFSIFKHGKKMQLINTLKHRTCMHTLIIWLDCGWDISQYNTLYYISYMSVLVKNYEWHLLNICIYIFLK